MIDGKVSGGLTFSAKSIPRKYSRERNRELGVSKLGWHENFFISLKIACSGFFNFYEIATIYQL